MMFKKLFVLVGLLVVMTACPPICNNSSEPEDLGFISSYMLEKVPYINDHQYSFIHNNGTVIMYNTSRTTVTDRTYCDHGCCDTYIYQNNITELTTSYPVFSIKLWMSNLYNEQHSITIDIGQSGFIVPLDNDETYDDIWVNGRSYSEVYKLKNISDININTIFVDSLYYQVNNGILKIKMSNDEYYDLEE